MRKFENALSSERFTPYVRDSIIPKAPTGWQWESLMEKALHLAEQAQKQGEVPVGALIVSPQGTILGEGCNCCIATHDSTAHAEIVAMRQAEKKLATYRLPQALCVVTLEPCAMCAEALLQARIAGIVFGAQDALAGAIVSHPASMAANLGEGIWYMGGVCGDRCAAILTQFFASLRTNPSSASKPSRT